MDLQKMSFSPSLRSLHASSSERLLLLSVLSHHLLDLENRDTDAKTLSRRAEVWATITKTFNERTHVQRTRSQVQTLYKNMKAKAKKYQIRQAESEADGSPAPEKDEVSEMLLSMLSAEQKHRRQLIQRAAVMALSESMPQSTVHSFENIMNNDSNSNDVTQFLKQELYEHSCEVVIEDATAREEKGHDSQKVQQPDCQDIDKKYLKHPNTLGDDISFQACIESPVDTNYSSALSAEDLPKVLPNSSSEPIARTGSVSSKRSASHSPPEIVLQALHSDYQRSPPEMVSSLIYPPNKKSKTDLTENVEDLPVQFDTNTFLQVLKATQSPLGKVSEPPIKSSDTGGKYCCSDMHNHALQMMQKEHQLKMSILREQLRGAESENKFKLAEHQLRMDLLKRQAENISQDLYGNNNDL